jgi:hypothetical protein
LDNFLTKFFYNGALIACISLYSSFISEIDREYDFECDDLIIEKSMEKRVKLRDKSIEEKQQVNESSKLGNNYFSIPPLLNALSFFNNENTIFLLCFEIFKSKCFFFKLTR